MAKKILTDLDFNSSSRITNLPDPVAAQHPATKAYVDAAIEGIAWKDSVRVATQTNLNLASPGATIDGITMVSGDRVLVKSQTAGSENGIYVWNGASVAMTRALDANTAAELEQASATVEEGSSAGTTYRQTAVNFTLDTGSVAFTTFGTSAPSTNETTPGIIELATQSETDAGTDDQRAVTPLKLNNWSGKKLKYSTNVGDGSATSFTITHNFGTRDVQVVLYLNSGTYEEVLCDAQHSTTNAITLVFASAPAAGAYRVVVLG